MTHSPPVPPANQPPYPRAEAPHRDPHEPSAAEETTPAVARGDVATSNPRSDQDGGRHGLAALIGIGSVAALIVALVAASKPGDRRKGSKAAKAGKKAKKSKAAKAS